MGFQTHTKARSFQDDSCAILSSLKIMIILNNTSATETPHRPKRWGGTVVIWRA